VPDTFFSQDDLEPVTSTGVSFRKLSKTTAQRRDAVLASATLTLGFFRVIEESFSLPLQDIPTLDTVEPESAADMVRRRWGLGDRPVSNMVHLLESKGVRFASLDSAYSDIDAFCFVRDGVPYVFMNTSKSAERQRFDAAHELGHLVLHRGQDMDVAESKERENQANRFASAFLMPQSGILRQAMAGANLERILVGRSFWKVAAMALTYRLHDLHLLSDWQYRSMCVELSDQGFRSKEPGGVVPETSSLLRQTVYGRERRVGIAQAAAALSLYPDEVRAFIQRLVPTVA